MFAKMDGPRRRINIAASERISEETSGYLNLLRGAASVYVVIYHIRALLFLDPSDVPEGDQAARTALLLCTQGHFAVLLFFVLSGYLISASVYKSYARGDWDWAKYLVHRLSRLWTVLLPALALTAAWDVLGMRCFGMHGVYGGLPSDTDGLGYAILPRLRPEVLLSNMFFLQQVLTPTYGTNGPLWSLSYEFWYYILFPLLLGAFAAPRRYSILLNTLGFTLVALLIGKVMLYQFPIWLAGAALWMLGLKKFSSRRAFTVTTAAVWLAWTAACFGTQWMRAIGHLDVIRDLIIGMLGAIAVGVTCSAPPETVCSAANERRSRTWSHRLAGMSYSLYLVHMPVIAFIHAYTYHVTGAKWYPDLPHLAAGAGVLAFCLLYAYLIASLTERHTDKVRAQMLALLKRRSGYRCD